jgi:serine/threonine protein kinase
MVNFENEADKKNLNMMRAQIKIIDFGFAMYLSKSSLTFTALGSPINMDPIILQKFTKRGIDRDKVGYDFKADIWSLGTICYEMLIGEAVFNAETLNELVRKVENGSYSIPTCVSREVVSFLNGMLQYKGEKRLSAEELSKHPFLTKNIKNFSKINTRKVSKKINNQNLNINIKKNQTIWAIFNEDDEKQLAKIKGNCSSERPISEEKKKKKKKDNNKQINYNNQQYNKNNNNNNIKINPVENQNKKGVNQKKVNENPGMQQKNNKEQKIFIKPKPELQPLIREKNSFDDFDFDSIIKFPANMDFPFEKINNPGYNINRINNMQQYRINNIQQYRINNMQQHSIFDDDEDMEVCSIY